MYNNYQLEQIFLDMVKQFSISNPDKEINHNVIYSMLIGFNIEQRKQPYKNIDYLFPEWEDRYDGNSNLYCRQVSNRKGFVWFSHGNLKGNEIKLYIPLDAEHIWTGANQLFDFIASTSIEHQSKIADIIRNDNLVVRVNNLEDADTIIRYVRSNPYIMSGLLNVNPFLPNNNGIGITMDNTLSYNDELSKLISGFLNSLKHNNRLDLFTVSEFNKYVKYAQNLVRDPDLKDIYQLIIKTTNPNFKIEDFIDHANYKLSDKYDQNRERITDPRYYFESAVKLTTKIHPENKKEAIRQYLRGNSSYFTNRDKSREGLVKYVHPGDVISIMRTKLYENNVPIPNTDEQLIDNYLNLLLPHNINYFDLIKNAYLTTLNVYNEKQADTALRELIQHRETKYFTNQLQCRNNLIKYILDENILGIILSGINMDNLDINNVNEIVRRFKGTIGVGEATITNKLATY